MTKQDIAKSILKIEWIAVQMDKADESSKLWLITDELLKLSKEEIINLFFTVIEAEQLKNEEPFKDLIQFKYL